MRSANFQVAGDSSAACKGQASTEEVVMVKRQVVDRVFLCALVFITLLMAYVDDSGVIHYLVGTGGAPAHFCMALLGVANTIAAVDVLVNDILPEGFHVRVHLRTRQRLWMLIGCSLAMIVYVIFRSQAGVWTGLLYAVLAIRCALVAFLDLKYEFKGSRRVNHA